MANFKDIQKILVEASCGNKQWVSLGGGKALVRGEIQWESLLLVHLGKDIYLEMANKDEAISACKGHDKPISVTVDQKSMGAMQSSKEFDISEEFTKDDIKLMESKGGRRIAHTQNTSNRSKVVPRILPISTEEELAALSITSPIKDIVMERDTSHNSKDSTNSTTSQSASTTLQQSSIFRKARRE